MATQKRSNTPSKIKGRAPIGLKKLDLYRPQKNAKVTGLTEVSAAAKAHSNTIIGTNNRTDYTDYIDHTDYEADDIANHDMDRPIGLRGRAQPVSTTRVDMSNADCGTGQDESPLVGHDGDIADWDVVRRAESELAHIASCICLDTVGLEFSDVNAETAKLAKSFNETDDDGNAVDGTGWNKASLQSPEGKRSLAVNYVGKTLKLRIEGSNAMHRQGHNVVASGDLTMTAFSMIRAVKQSQSLPWDVSVGHQLAHGHDVVVTRIDVVILVKVPEGVSKSALINALAIAGIGAGVNTSLYVNESVYFDQSSQLEGQKIYDKEAELNRARKGGLPDKPGMEHLHALTQKTVRLEAVFRAKKLVEIARKHGGRPHPCLFTKELLAEMVRGLMKKFMKHGDVFRRLNRDELMVIPLPFRSTVVHWQNGENLLDIVKSSRILKQQKAYLKKNHDINLNAPAPDQFRGSMSLFDILAPEHFIPVPAEIRNNPALFYELPMDEVRAKLRLRVGSGIGSLLIDPYRLPETLLEVRGEQSED